MATSGLMSQKCLFKNELSAAGSSRVNEIGRNHKRLCLLCERDYQKLLSRLIDLLGQCCKT